MGQVLMNRRRVFAFVIVAVLILRVGPTPASADEAVAAPPPAKPGERIDDLGDVLRWLIPLSGLAATVGLQDWEGSEQWCYSIGVGQLITELLKETVHEDRPDGSHDPKSFPSGHTSATFGGAAFIQQRYGWRYALPAYAGALYTGWSRVELDKHYPHDVLAGAAVGILSSYIFTSPYGAEKTVGLFYEESTLGIRISWKL